MTQAKPTDADARKPEEATESKTTAPAEEAEAATPETDDDELDYGGIPKDAPNMKRFLGCGG